MDRPGRSASDEHDEGPAERDVHELLEDPGARRIEPLEVVDDDDARAVQLDEAVQVTMGQRPDRGRHLGRVGRHQGRLGFPARERRIAGDRGDGARPALGIRGIGVGGQQEPAHERAGVGSVLIGNDLGQRPAEPIRVPGPVRDVVDPGPRDPASASVGLKVREQPRLADPGLALDYGDAAALARRELREQAGQHASFVGATHEPARGRQPRLEAGLADQSRDPDRPSLAAEHALAQVLHRESLASRSERGLIQEDLAGRGLALDAGRGRDRGARERPIKGTGHPARRGHHLTGREPDPDLERLPGRILEMCQFFPDLERAVRGPQGVVVMCHRPAEDGEHRIADELLAGAVVALDRLDHRHQGGIDAAADLLRVVLGDQADVVDEVGEECRDDSSVAGRPGGGHIAGFGRGVVARLDAGAAQRAEPGRFADLRPARSTAHRWDPPSPMLVGPLGAGPIAESTARVAWDREGSARRGPSRGRCAGGLPPRSSADREERLLVGAGGPDAHPGGDRTGERRQRPGGRPGLALGHGRHADVAALADRHVERHSAQELQAMLLGEALAAAAPEDLGQLTAVRDRRTPFMFSTTPRIGTLIRLNIASALPTSVRATSCGVVTSTVRPDGTDCASVELRVGGAGRQVDDEVVELAPVDVAQELLDRAAHERAAPDDGLALGDEELDRDAPSRRGARAG